MSSFECKNLYLNYYIQIGKYKDKKISIISGGQCQRVAVARGILNHPKVIFADEPTAALDKVSRKLVDGEAIFKE